MFTSCSEIRHYVVMALCALCIAATSCSTQKQVFRGDEGRIINDTRNTKKEPVAERDTKAKDSSNDVVKALLREAYSWIGTPYLYGGKTKKGADCSGFVMMAYQNALGIKLPRTSYDQGEFCTPIDKKHLEVGDLVFFRTGTPDRVSHVGIYIGEGKFIHASSSRGVMISDLNSKYFTEHYHHSGKVAAYTNLVKKGKLTSHK